VTGIVTDGPDVCGGKRMTTANKAWQRERLVEGVSLLNARFFRDVGVDERCLVSWNAATPENCRGFSQSFEIPRIFV
jgi:hypothetical protein